MCPIFESNKLNEYRKNIQLQKEDDEIRKQYEKDKKDFDNGILELTKNGKTLQDDKLRTNSELINLDKLNVNQKRILQFNKKNSDESRKTFKVFQGDAKENYNRIRQSFFLGPITNELGEINKEDLQKYIIQTNEVANAKKTLTYFNDLSTVEVESQSNSTLDLHILVEQEIAPQTIVKIRLPSSSP